LAFTPLCAVLLGEGVWALFAVTKTTSPVYWIIEIVLSVLVMVLVFWRARLWLRQNLLVLAVWIGDTLAFDAGWILFSGDLVH
ncbi:MAG TPA: DUF6518 family protein, partial [Terrimesophilobacter sp.]|nr:DUF6518 family protein [Terrimesophilobacter sp.]